MAKQKAKQLDLIQEILEPSFIDNSKILIEKGVATKGPFEMKRKVVEHRGIDYLLYRYDPDKTNFFPYFSRTSGLKKICDYILFAEEANHLYLVLIELKLGTDSATQQLLASESFINFITASAKRVGKELTENIHIRKVRISEERAKKRNRTTKVRSLEFDENQVINYDHASDFRIKEVLAVDF